MHSYKLVSLVIHHNFICLGEFPLLYKRAQFNASMRYTFSGKGYIIPTLLASQIANASRKEQSSHFNDAILTAQSEDDSSERLTLEFILIR
jgi:hypothetical protein